MVLTQSRARVINTCMALPTTRKGNLNIAQYVGKMKLDEEDLVGYILAGLDSDYDSDIGGHYSCRVYLCF
jgi:hypothetical protein